ncbi:MAG: LapA family protein [Syntrophorhabdus sp.]|nr:LapA family protein [Syntrophorhabdus sp.]
MKIRTFLLVVIIAAVAAFVALNWNSFLAPTTLSLGVSVVQAPLGLVMLGLLVLLAALFLIFVVYLQTSFLIEARRNAKELQAKQELADKAEVSRLTELRGYLEEELKRQADLDAESRAAILTRLDQLDSDVRSTLEQTGNTLSAYLDELEDRLERQGLTSRQDRPE